MNETELNRFLTYDEQMGELDRHGLIITDRGKAKETLSRIGYRDLIGEYKRPFIDPETRKYLGNTTFDDILALYDFDKNLRNYDYGLFGDIETHLRQVISYSFCQLYGINQSAYLDLNNYNIVSNNQQKAAEQLLVPLANVVESNTTHEYIVHQREKYGNVPIWAIMKHFSFGQLSTFYSLLPTTLQYKIVKHFPGVLENDLGQYLKCLTPFRNICAHGDKLFSFRLQLDFPDTKVHKNLGIELKGKQNVYGKHDFFGLVIAFKYLLPDNEFRKYVAGLKTIIADYFLASQRLKDDLFGYLGFPSNWEDILDCEK